MPEARIGRVLPASIHQGIVVQLPTRLDFYEHWLHPAGLRNGSIGVAPFRAVLSFLRRDGTAYGNVTSRAGEYAARWFVDALPGVARRVVRTLPSFMRTRVVLWMCRRLVRQSSTTSRARTSLRRGVATISLTGSLFCDVRDTSTSPLCGYYASAIASLLQQFNLIATARITQCRAAGARACCISVSVSRATGRIGSGDPR